MKKVLSSVALGLLLIGCECTDTCQNVDANAAATPGTPGHFKQTVKDRVFFNFDSSTLSADAKKSVEAQAGWLKVYSSTTASVVGKCDPRGTSEYNLALGARRANAVEKELVKLGIDKNRLKTISYGKEKLEVVGDTEEAYAQNRVGITVIN
ncbi:MAG: OmpA family protein [Proteobacteria bacterium]|jgi:peptidoglycan-associated lipoprotein|nr:OmpA family protein [Pseudomonadota bacterium]